MAKRKIGPVHGGRERASAEELRNAIDRGQGRDKVAGGDPAAAPLGTDAEAGGVPPTRAEVELASAQEIRRPDPQPEASERGGTPAWVWAGAAAALILLLVLALT